MLRMVMLTVLVGCSPATLHAVNRVGLVVAEGSVACDWGETRTAAAAGWNHQHEENPIMGRTPSVATVDAYMAGAAGAVAAAWTSLPERWRFLAWGSVVALQAVTIVRDAGETPVCGVF
jgi:hypothetical protein